MKKKKRIFASAPSEQAQQTKKEVLSGKCLRTQHDKADRQTKLFKAADGIIAALKKRSALPVHANNPRAAFTLAEVLIALTVIGIVSALTIPTLVQKTNKQEYVSALKKMHSTLSQVTNMIIAEEGSPKGTDGGWADTVQHAYEMYKKHLSTIAIYEPGEVKYDDGYGSAATSYGRFVLADGSYFNIGAVSKSCTANQPEHGDSGVCAYLHVDVNGKKGPNKGGYDNFRFILKENGIFPSGCEKASGIRNGVDVTGKPCNEIAGSICTCKVLREGKIDY